MGTTIGDIGLFRLKRLSQDTKGRTFDSETVSDGSAKDNAWGTYIHGIFDNDEFRRSFLNSIRESKGLDPVYETIDYAGIKDKAMNRWAGILKENIDMDFILKQTGGI